MFEVRYAEETDKDFWFTLDDELSETEFLLKVRDQRAYVICKDNKPIGVIRYNLMWDIIPFLTLIYFKENCRGKGYGKHAMLYWENEMRELGYSMVMTSTMAVDETQHFYRKLGYIDRGSICFDGTPHEQTLEMFMLKKL